MAAKALPVEKQVLEVIRDGLPQEVAAARCGITTNQARHVWETTPSPSSDGWSRRALPARRAP